MRNAKFSRKYFSQNLFSTKYCFFLHFSLHSFSRKNEKFFVCCKPQFHYKIAPVISSKFDLHLLSSSQIVVKKKKQCSKSHFVSLLFQITFYNYFVFHSEVVLTTPVTDGKINQMFGCFNGKTFVKETVSVISSGPLFPQMTMHLKALSGQ